MKKATIVMLALAFCFVSGHAFAVTDLATGDVSTAGGLSLKATAPANATIGKLSTNVYVGVQYSGTGYALDTYHSSGTKAYGTAYDATAIYFMDIGLDGVAGGTFVAPTSSNALEAFPETSWTKM